MYRTYQESSSQLVSVGHAHARPKILGKRPWVLTAQAPKLGVAGCTKEVFEWFNYPCTSTYPWFKVICIVALSMVCFQPKKARAAVEKAYRAKNGLTCSPIAAFITCGTQNSCCKRRTLWTRLWIWCVQTFAAGYRGTWSASEWLQLCTLAQ